MPKTVQALFAGFVFFLINPQVVADGLLQERYKMAREAQQDGDKKRYQQLRSSLAHYPLALYLDYYDLLPRVDRIGPDDALNFLAKAENSPLANRFKQRYLMSLGRRNQWGSFLQIAQTRPNNVTLQCFYYRAKHTRGFQQEALAGGEKLWLYGRSRPDACDPLFNHMEKAGVIDDGMLWQRMLLAFDARQQTLMRYLGKKLSKGQRPWADLLLDVYQHPHHLSRTQHFNQDRQHIRHIVARGLTRLAKKDPVKAIALWQRYDNTLSFDEKTRRHVTKTIARQSLIKKEEQAEDWVDSQLTRLSQDELIEIRLRWLLQQNRWADIAKWIAHLSQEKQQTSTWQYWRARALEELGLSGEAVATYQQLSAKRSFYGFLSAMKTNGEYHLQHQPLKVTPQMLPHVLSLPAIRRVEELMALGDVRNARSEWNFQLSRLETSQIEALARYALHKDWPSLAISAAIKAQAWDAVDVRFPDVHNGIFERFAKKRNVSQYDLLALARRESSFYPLAESSKGARGLMQLMPGTAKNTARKIGFRYRSRSQLFKPEDNVRLGSAYYKQMLDRYDGVRPLAFAAYNAGPNAVKRWLKKSAKTQPLDVWIETIPYRETRNYVQAVLSYGLVYQLKNGKEPIFLTEDEWKRQY